MKRKQEIEIIMQALEKSGAAERNEKTTEAIKEGLKEIRREKWKNRKQQQDYKVHF